MTITSSQTGGFTSAPFLLRRRSRFVQYALTAIERDRIAYVAFAALLNKSAGRKAAQEKGEVTQTDEDAHEVACGVGEDAC